MEIVLLLLALIILLNPSVGVGWRITKLYPAAEIKKSLWPWKKIMTVSGFLALMVVLHPLTLLAVLVITVTVAKKIRKKSSILKQSDEVATLSKGLELLIAELRIGTHPVDAFSIAAQECSHNLDSDIPRVFLESAARAKLGGDVPSGIAHSAYCNELAEDWNRIAVAWSVSESHGLPIADLLEAVRLDVVERQKFSNRTESGLAGARATAGILAVLPIVGIMLGQFMGAEPLKILMFGGVGGWLLLIGVTLACLGLIWSDWITERSILE
ncbi:MAG: type II secretion system F family protein [Mycobacteriaceae bacterium]